MTIGICFCNPRSDGHGAVDGSSPPQVNIYGPAHGPAVYLNKAEDVLIQDLAFHGQITAVYIGDAAGSDEGLLPFSRPLVLVYMESPHKRNTYGRSSDE
jgi:hypothetical protein